VSAKVRERLRTATLPDGTRALVLDCEIPAAAPELIREGLARRAIVNGGGTCPCGARWPRPNRAQRRRMKQPGTVTHLQVEHEPNCPAGNEILVPLIRAWEAGR
jgi:hypothetical protein